MKKRLIELLATKSYKYSKKPFKLSNGESSNHYIDCKKVTLTAEGMNLIGRIIQRRICSRGMFFNVDYIGGLTFGADAIANAVSHLSYNSVERVDSFSIRKEPKGHGTNKWIEGGMPPGSLVLVVEDVITTGSSIIKAIQKITEYGCRVVKVIALVDRQEGGIENIIKYTRENMLHCPLHSIVTMLDIKNYHYKRKGGD
jgi:orotate phosphoribosyltransferase